MLKWHFHMVIYKRKYMSLPKIFVINGKKNRQQCDTTTLVPLVIITAISKGEAHVWYLNKLIEKIRTMIDSFEGFKVSVNWSLISMDKNIIVNPYMHWLIKSEIVVQFTELWKNVVLEDIQKIPNKIITHAVYMKIYTENIWSQINRRKDLSST